MSTWISSLKSPGRLDLKGKQFKGKLLPGSCLWLRQFTRTLSRIDSALFPPRAKNHWLYLKKKVGILFAIMRQRTCGIRKPPCNGEMGTAGFSTATVMSAKCNIERAQLLSLGKMSDTDILKYAPLQAYTPGELNQCQATLLIYQEVIGILPRLNSMLRFHFYVTIICYCFGVGCFISGGYPEFCE